MQPLFLPRGWHRSSAGRWLLVSEARRPLALVARLAPTQWWSWRTALPVHRGYWWAAPRPEPFDLTIERACKALRDGAGQVSAIRYAPGFAEALELQMLNLWTMEIPHVDAPDHASV